MLSKNTICLWYDGTALDAATFYAKTFPDSAVGAIHRAPGDYPVGKQGDVLTVEFTVMGVPCLGLNGGPGVPHTDAFSFQVATDDQAETDRQWNAIIGGRQLVTYARLAPGVTETMAKQELRAFAARAVEKDAANKDWGWTTQPLRAVLLSGADNALLFAQGGAAVLLVLAVCNLASLLLAWAAERERETAVRLALGASGWRVVRQFMVQSLALVSLGGALGVLLAASSLPTSSSLPRRPEHPCSKRIGCGPAPTSPAWVPTRAASRSCPQNCLPEPRCSVIFRSSRAPLASFSNISLPLWADMKTSLGLKKAARQPP